MKHLFLPPGGLRPTLPVLTAAVILAGVGRLEGQSALVLSGGGARGIAHAGVVRGLDSLGVDPEIVVGTSMGAVVGALYAAGFDGDEVWDEFVRRDLARLFDPDPVSDGPRWEARHPLIRVDLGGGPHAHRKGFVVDGRINRILTHALFEPGVRAGSDFDRLPRRYRAVSVDLQTGETIVLASGDLPRAVRTSMSIPGVFAALELEERTLVDGGLANYLPIGVARELGARLVIASDVVKPVEPLGPMTPKTIGSRGFHWMNVNARDEPDTADVTLYPELDPALTAGSFLSDMEAIARVGYRAVLDAWPIREPLEPGRPGPTSGAARRDAEPVRTGVPGLPARLDAVEVHGTGDSALVTLVRGAMTEAVGDYRTEAVLDGVDRLYATGLFDGVWPRVGEGTGPGRPLHVNVEPKVPRMLFGGAGFDTDRGGRAWLSGAWRGGWGPAPVTGRLSGYVGEWERYASTDLTVHHPRWVPLSLAVGGHVGERRVRHGTPEGRTGEVRRAGASLTVERAMVDPRRAVTARVLAEHLDGPGVEGEAVGMGVSWGWLEPLPPLLGLPLRLEGEVRFGDVAYWTVRAAGSRSWAAGPLRGAVVADVRYAGDDAPPDALPALGDGVVPGFRWGEERGRGAYAAGVDLGYPLFLAGLLRLRLRGAWLEGLSGSLGEEGDVYGFDLSGVWRTPFGSVSLGGGGNTRGHWRLDLGIGTLW